LVLRPERIVRVRIIGLRSKRQEIISALHDLGVIQIEDVAPELSNLMDKRVSVENYELLSRQLLRFRGLEAMLPRGKANRRYFASVRELLEAADSIKIDERLRELKNEEGALQTKLREKETFLSIARLLSPLKFDLSVYNNPLVVSFIAEQKEGTDATSIIRKAIQDAVIYPLDEGRLLVALPAGKEGELAKVANEAQFRIIAVPRMEGAPDQFIEQTQKEIEGIKSRLQEIGKELSDISSRYYESVVQIREQLEIEARKYEVSERLLATAETFALEGWMPERYVDTVRSVLEQVTEGNVIVSRVQTKEQPPTLLRNPRRIRLFEFFIRFYSLPQEYEIDPTLVFAIVFPVLFGVMVGDFGYGIVILLISLFIIHRLDHPPKKSHIPRFISNFITMIMGPNALKTVAKALIPSSIIAIIAGILFNEFFGFAVLPFTVLNLGLGRSTIALVTTSTLFNIGVGKLILFTGYLGLALVSLGLIFGAVNEYTRGHMRGVFGKIGWLMFAWGISVLGLDLIHGISITQSISGIASIALMIAGVGVIFGGEGTMGVMELPSIVSHILSYTRIVGILLASIILAQVINIIFFGGVHRSILLGIVGAVILIIGQLFNLIIAVFEPGIQGARLLYVEFFSKFYRGNGRYFRPFSSPRNYTIRQFDLEKIKEG
jgi:V/A-type H+-transporting ATPase subunit I